MSPPLVFQHEAMKTTYTLRLLTEDKAKAQQVSLQCIELIDTLEHQLSRHYEGGDIWMVNHMKSGDSLFVSEDCYACLRLAMQAHEQTGGLFDITLGRQIEHRKNASEGDAPAPEGQLMVDPDHPAVHCIEAGREIDLGGIGKGYTLDRLKDICLDWGIEGGLLASGASTQLAFGTANWPIRLNSGKASVTVKLQNRALSASGTGIQGSHIISPDPNTPEAPHERVWLITESAALADAWSTAALLMHRHELEQVCGEHLRIFLAEADAITEVGKASTPETS